MCSGNQSRLYKIIIKPIVIYNSEIFDINGEGYLKSRHLKKENLYPNKGTTYLEI